jgi:hypothetical protein
VAAPASLHPIDRASSAPSQDAAVWFAAGNSREIFPAGRIFIERDSVIAGAAHSRADTPIQRA